MAWPFTPYFQSAKLLQRELFLMMMVRRTMVEEKAGKIRWLLLDVDGVMTDGLSPWMRGGRRSSPSM